MFNGARLKPLGAPGGVYPPVVLGPITNASCMTLKTKMREREREGCKEWGRERDGDKPRRIQNEVQRKHERDGYSESTEINIFRRIPAGTRS